MEVRIRQSFDCQCGYCMVHDQSTVYCTNKHCKEFRNRYLIPTMKLDRAQYITEEDSIVKHGAIVAKDNAAYYGHENGKDKGID